MNVTQSWTDGNRGDEREEKMISGEGVETGRAGGGGGGARRHKNLAHMQVYECDSILEGGKSRRREGGEVIRKNMNLIVNNVHRNSFRKRKVEDSLGIIEENSL